MREGVEMKLIFPVTLAAIVSVAAVFPPVVLADQTIRCESRHHRYQKCPIDTHGYVRLTRQLSHADCRQGRTWDYDRRGIWVDDGCAAEFVVESRHHTSHHSDHKGQEAAAAVAALALIAVAAAASDDDHDRYRDEDYHHGGHSSYVPRWMIGDFAGYNLKYGAEVSMHINSDGRVKARVNGTKLKGYVNDERMYIGDAEFYIDRAGDGFNTTQVGDRSNQVHDHRDR